MDPRAADHARVARADDAGAPARRGARSGRRRCVGCCSGGGPVAAGAARARCAGRGSGGADLRDDRGVLADRHVRVAARRRRCGHARRTTRCSCVARSVRGGARMPTAGCTPAISGGSTSAAGSRSSAARPTRSSPAARTSRPPRSRHVLLDASRGRRRRGARAGGSGVGGGGGRDGGRCATGRRGDAGRAAGVLRRAAGGLQGAQGVRVRRGCRAARPGSCCGERQLGAGRACTSRPTRRDVVRCDVSRL